MINGVRNAVLVAITFVVCHTTDGQYFLGCPPVDDTHDAATILPNPFNCSTFYICAQGTPLLFVCPGNLQFNYELEVCDYPERANCFELQQYPEPGTTDVQVSQPEAEDVQQERKPEHAENAVSPPTEGEVRVTPEPHPEHSQDTEKPQSHYEDFSSESADLPVETRSYEKAEKELIAPTEPVETPKAQPPQEEAVSERQPEDTQGPDESGIVLEPSLQTDSAAVLQPQPSESTTEEELHDALATAASTVEPNSARSRGPTYPDHETTPQASEEAEPESDQGGGSSYEENLGTAVQPRESQQNPESQTTEMPGESERQDTAVQAEPIPDKKSVSSQNTNENEADSGSAIEPTLSALELQPQPSTQEPKEEPETEFHGDATQAHQGEPTPHTSSPVSDSEQLEEEPADAADLKAQTALEEAQPADEQAPSESIPPATLQPEQLPADAQVVEETALPSADFEPQSTDGLTEVQEPTYKPSQLKPAHSYVQSGAVDDTTESTIGQTVARAQEPSEPAPEPSVVAHESESVVTQEPTGILRGEPSDVVEEQQSSRGVTQSDQTAEPESGIESVASEPLEPAYVSTEEPSQPEATEGEANLAPETKQAVPEPEQGVTKPPATPGLEHNETQPQLAPARQPAVGASEAESTENDVDANIEDQLSEEQMQSSTEFDHSEPQPTPQPTEVRAENTEVAEDPHSAPDAEVLQSEETEGTADHSPLVNDALPEASSLPPARPHDTLETNDEPITMQTEKSIDTEPAASILDSKADTEATKQPASQLGLEDSNPVPVEEEVDVTKTQPESVPIQQQDASTSVPNDPDHDNILQTSGGAARVPETDSLALAPVDERVSDVAEPTQALESSGGSLTDDREANVDSAPEEAETPAVLDDVDAQYNEPRNNAVEIDYYT